MGETKGRGATHVMAARVYLRKPEPRDTAHVSSAKTWLRVAAATITAKMPT